MSSLRLSSQHYLFSALRPVMHLYINCWPLQREISLLYSYISNVDLYFYKILLFEHINLLLYCRFLTFSTKAIVLSHYLNIFSFLIFFGLLFSLYVLLHRWELSIEVGGSPEWMFAVGMGTVISSTPLSRAQRDGKVFLGGPWASVDCVCRKCPL